MNTELKDGALAFLENMREAQQFENSRLLNRSLSELSSLTQSYGSALAAEMRGQIEAYRENPSRRYIFQIRDDQTFILAGFVDCSFNKALNLEFLEFEEAQVDARLKKIFPSNAYSVRLRRVSKGLENPSVVALFPEDWKYPIVKSREDIENHPVFFFICRFVERFKKVSLPAIRYSISEGFSNLVQAFSEEDNLGLAEELCADWMWMHERSHREGVLPYEIHSARGDLRYFKNSWHSGAFEEMRADVGGICEIVKSEKFPEERRQLLAEFILFERLVRYPVQFLLSRSESKLNYDSVGSQALLNFLRERDFVETAEGRIRLNKDWADGLQMYSELANTAELEALQIYESASERELSGASSRVRRAWKKYGSQRGRMYLGRQHLENFIKKLARFDDRSNSYPIDQYYYEIASQLSG